VVLALGLTACGGPLAVPPASRYRTEALAAPPAPGAELVIEIEVPADFPERGVIVTTRCVGVQQFRAASGDGAIPLVELAAEGSDGGAVVLDTELADDDHAFAVSVRDRVDGVLTMRYRIVPASASAPGGVEVFADGVVVDGRRLLLPEDALARDTRLSVRAPFIERATVATSLGLGADHRVEMSPTDVAELIFLAGRLGTVRFQTPEGADDVAVLGPRSFDVRWVAAEAALVRTRIDRWFGGAASDRFTTLFTTFRSRLGESAFTVQPRGVGVHVRADAEAAWDREGRVVLAHVYARRWAGGRLRFGRPPDDDWFGFGLSRAVALETLHELGLLDEEELAAEVNMLEAILAVPPAEGTAGAERARAMAAGALYAAALGARLAERSEPPRTLRELVWPLVGEVDPAPEARSRMTRGVRRSAPRSVRPTSKHSRRCGAGRA
jgi:hypothetical protein